MAVSDKKFTPLLCFTAPQTRISTTIAVGENYYTARDLVWNLVLCCSLSPVPHQQQELRR
jgi:hypothetical protein